MTAPAVAWYGVGSNVGKVVDGDSDTGWSASLAVDTVNFVEGTGSLGEKVSNTTIQAQTVDTTDVTGEPFDFSSSGGNDGDHLFGWLNIFAAYDTQANGGFGLVMVSDEVTIDSDGVWYVGPQAGYLGGWASFVINPSADFDAVTAGDATWTLSGNPAQLSGVDGFGVRWKTTQTITGNTNNAFLDALSVGLGYRMTLGDSGSTEGTFADFITFEDTVTTGRFGGLRNVSGILFAKSKLIIGGTGSENTEFIDTGATVIWEQQVLSDGAASAVAAGFYELSAEQGSGTTDVDITSCTMAAIAPHTVVMDWSGVNSVDIDACVIDRAGTITLDSVCTLTNSNITNSGQIILGEADLSGTKVLLSTVAADIGAVFDDRTTSADTDLTEYTDCEFSQGTNAHHAIEFGVNVGPGDDDLTITGVEFTGFSGTENVDGSTFRFNATTGTINLNLIGCTVDGAAPTQANIGVDDAAGISVTVVISPVTSTFKVLDNNLADLQNARVLVEASDGTGDLLFQASTTSLTQSAGTATCDTTASHGLTTGDEIVMRGAGIAGYNLTAVVTVSDVDTFTYAVNSGLGSPATGTPVVTGVVVDGDTDVNGEIADTRTWGNPQPITGRVRRSTTSPFFKTGVITGTISTTTGLSSTTVLVIDE